MRRVLVMMELMMWQPAIGQGEREEYMNAGLEAQQRGSELLERIEKQILSRIWENLKETYDGAEFAYLKRQINTLQKQ